MPVTVSDSDVLIAALAARTPRKPRRRAFRKATVATANSGRVTKVTAARAGLISSIAPRMNRTFTESPRMLTMPSAMNWRTASTSLVTLVRVAPTGVRSK